jgi:DNA-binding transcriptional regulator GbsR (MarR family)
MYGSVNPACFLDMYSCNFGSYRNFGFTSTLQFLYRKACAIMLRMARSAPKNTLPVAAQKFILHWGEMAGRWGVQRAVAQIYALLYVSSRPLNAEEIAGTLQLARSTVSAAIRDLEAAALIRNATVLGDRRAQFQCNGTPAEALSRVLRERKAREVDAGAAILRECIAVAENGNQAERALEARFQSLLESFELLSAKSEELIRSMAPPASGRRKRERQ